MKQMPTLVFGILPLNSPAVCANKETFRDLITKFTDGKTSEKKNIKEKMCGVMKMPIPKCGTLGIQF
jgi:hypothetical protein